MSLTARTSVLTRVSSTHAEPAADSALDAACGLDCPRRRAFGGLRAVKLPVAALVPQAFGSVHVLV